MSNKKSSKKEEELMQQQQKLQEQLKRQEERKLKEAKLQQLINKSAPLTDYGLIDAYQFFLLQLASSGIPQGNVYEFAAQVMLKFEKSKNKRKLQLQEVERTNEQAVKIVSESNKDRKPPRAPRDVKPQLLPFKGEISSRELELLGRK